MNMWRQLESVAKNRWCGAYWQSKGLKVIPTISWSTPSSYEFCFDGVEKSAIVAISMIGCKGNSVMALLETLDEGVKFTAEEYTQMIECLEKNEECKL